MSLEKKLPEKEPEKGLTKRQMILTTIVIFYGNVTYGCAMNAFSPALTDFKRKFDTDTSEISVVFTASIGCYMVGALLCTLIYNLINRQFVVVLLFAGITFSMMVAPHVPPNLTLFYCIGGLLGFCIGCYDSAQFVWIMEMWQSKSAPYIQAQHFCFAIGTVISPLLMAPFLTEEEDDENSTTTSGTTTSMTTTTTDASEEEKNKKLFVPFTILGCLTAVTAIGQLILFLFMRYRPPPPEEKDIVVETKKEEERTGNFVQRQWPGWPVARLVILSMLTLGFYQGMEMCTMQLFPTFGQESELGLSEKDSANTLTGLTVAFAAGRGVAIPLVFMIPPEYILFVDIAIVIVGNIILIGWGNTNLTMLWAAGILYGLGFSSLLPTFCAYMERYLYFTNTIGAMMIVSGSCVGAIYPLIVGGFIDDHPLVLTYPIFFSSGVIICAVATAYWTTTLRKKRNAL